ncbi:hypothetical protein, partial [Vibrio parahaemolyticus]|uniref:hypothetical protein n=1 Tax=Vibrio parahaemolyticus TaxID=670 RepID=UPI00117166F4
EREYPAILAAFDTVIIRPPFSKVSKNLLSRARVLFVLRDMYTSRFGKACKSVVSEMPELEIKKTAAAPMMWE